MTYASLKFYVFLCAVLIVYRFMPKKYRWYVLLAGSMLFYLLNVPGKVFVLFAVQIIVAWAYGRMLEGRRERWMMAGAAIVTLIPLTAVKTVLSGSALIPLGLAFYTLQMTAYLADVYKGKITAEKNVLRFALFISFFPQIIQGPIPRHTQLNHQLQEGNVPDEDMFSRGVMMIIWGMFLKMMIADKAAPLVNEVFDHYLNYSGAYYWAAGLFYSLQLYTDFLSCVTLSRGISLLFGIELVKNFDRPYLARSVREFWQKWHMSLGMWLRDYVYIPLGGSRRGKVRRRINVVIVFLVSGLWHGSGLNYLFWGLLHAVFQIIEDVLGERRPSSAFLTFIAVLSGWIIFRAPGLRAGLYMIREMFTGVHPSVFFDGSLLRLGIDGYDMAVLIMAAGVLAAAERAGTEEEILAKVTGASQIRRWWTAAVLIVLIWVFGTYGYGFSAAGFIYGGF